jgi:hypothetical protein
LRDLTLIVTDGHAPAALAREDVAAIERLPCAEVLMARGIRLARTSDWWLAVLGSMAAPPASVRFDALAPVAWFGATGERSNRMWFATPVRLTAAIDHVRLDAIPYPGTAEGAAIAADFQRQFAGDGLVLHPQAGPHWFLEMPRDLEASTLDPARVLGNDIDGSLPAGVDSGWLRRLTTEIQMWLHGRSGRPAGFNGLWIWGGGRVWPELAGRELPPAASDEPLLCGIYRLGGVPLFEEVATLDAARRLGTGSLIVTVSLEKWRAHGELQPLARLEREWLAPAWNGLTSGSLAACTLYLNRTLVRATRAHAWRIWRPRRHWAEG